jgi:MFS family permease
VAAWAGWTLDAFDFTAFLLIIAPIAKEFDVPVPEVAAVLTITLWMRLLGATASGWLADRIGRKTPLMISIAWYSVCNFLAGLAPGSDLAERIADAPAESVPVFRQGLIFNHQLENRDEIQGPLYRGLQRFGGARPPWGGGRGDGQGRFFAGVTVIAHRGIRVYASRGQRIDLNQWEDGRRTSQAARDPFVAMFRLSTRIQDRPSLFAG